ncbi:abortive infection family protein [Kiloniella sp.]|uniref:abortive infection family protein n=1 Tax=Kiloniella sp. TaxID=1938587 RepID=UPI003B02CD2F
MSADWTPGIRAFCTHWSHAPMLQQTFATLESELVRDSDACIDAAKGLVECACRLIIEELDDPASPLKPTRSDVALGELLGLATRALELGEIRDRAFANLIREHNKLADALRVLRNEGGTESHGKDGFVAKLPTHHRRAAILAADAIITFLFEAYLEREPYPVLTLEPFERFSEGNALIDAHSSLVAEADEEGGLLVTVRRPNNEEIPLAISPAQLQFGVDREAYKLALNACREAEPEEEEVA